MANSVNPDQTAPSGSKLFAQVYPSKYLDHNYIWRVHFQDQFDTIDFSDNDIRKLDGFPLLHRLKSLLLNNNRIV